MMIALALIIFILFLLAVCWRGAGIILHPPKMSPMTIYPEQFGLRYEKIVFQSADGLQLKGWLIPSTNNDKRTLVMCHGWGDNKGLLLANTHFLNSVAGFNLFYFDFRSHGESSGRVTSIGGLELRDFDAAIEWLKNNRPDLTKQLGVFGVSMGAAVAIASMPHHPILKCAVTESPFSDYRGVVRRWSWKNLHIPFYPLVWITLWILRLRLQDPKVDQFNPVEAAGQISPRPLFVIGGQCDYLMPEDDVRRVFSAAKEPKQLWIVPEATHAKCHEKAETEYELRVSNFYKQNLC